MQCFPRDAASAEVEACTLDEVATALEAVQAEGGDPEIFAQLHEAVKQIALWLRGVGNNLSVKADPQGSLSKQDFDRFEAVWAGAKVGAVKLIR